MRVTLVDTKVTGKYGKEAELYMERGQVDRAMDISRRSARVELPAGSALIAERFLWACWSSCKRKSYRVD